MKKILITGCSGYIGSHLCKLLENDYILHGLDIVQPSPDLKLEKFYQVDVARVFTLPDQTEPYDAIIHLAALVNVNISMECPMYYYFTNLNGTTNLMNKVPYKNFILASTGAAEQCASPYGTSKRGAEDCVREFCTKFYPSDYTIFRFYNVIGSHFGIKPTNPDGLMFNLMKSIDTGEFTIFGDDYTESKDGTCIRDYVHVMEICNAVKHAIENPSNSIENLGHGNGHTVSEIVDIFKKVNKCEFKVNIGPRRDGDIPVSVLKNVSSYMKSMYSIEDMLRIG